LKFPGTHQLLGYTDSVLALDESIGTKMENTEIFLIACERTGLEVTTEEPKHMFVSREESVGHNYNIKCRR
jgi:hypothetical protein